MMANLLIIIAICRVYWAQASHLNAVSHKIQSFAIGQSRSSAVKSGARRWRNQTLFKERFPQFYEYDNP